MALFEWQMFATEGDDAGIFVEDLSKALLTWAAMNYEKPLTVAQAASIFNTTPDIVRAAIEEGHWISYHGPHDDPTKQSIATDGD